MSDVMEKLRLRFSSGNDVPVTRAHITLDEYETLLAKVAELEAGSKAVAEVILIFDKTDKTFVRDTDELMKLAGLNPGMGYEAVGMQDDGTPVVFDCCGNFGYLDERYSPVITTPQPVKVPDALNYGHCPDAYGAFNDNYIDGWNACRDAMLAAQGPTRWQQASR